MPDEKIDRKRPVHAEGEIKPVQQRHVDDAVDDSFPASDPPAWTTSGSKSAAAECEPDALNEAPVPPGQGLDDRSANTTRWAADQASDLARNLYQRSQSYVEQGRRYLPEAERYYRQGAEAVSRPVQEHPLAAVVAVGVLGCALGWILGRRTAGPAPGPQWHPGPNRRPSEMRGWRPAPRSGGAAGHFSAENSAEAASHTNNSF